MAIIVVTNAKLLVNAVDLSDHVVKLGLDAKGAQIDTTAMSSSGWRAFLGGLKEWSLQVEFQQDFAASKVYATLWPLLGTVTTVEALIVNAARSVTNPGFTGSVLITDVPIIPDVQVGSLGVLSVSWPGTGALVPQTS